MSMGRNITPGVQLGRPPKPPGAGRNRRVVTFVTEKDYADLQALARDCGMSLSSICNDIVSTALCRERRGKMRGSGQV